ncbi:hypothetical protein CCUS01_12488 [Colletotrichum cuscutae]|uniref:Uncharacterized protein n=1 Tax=Colletotrichum cuscutae TaxID=1209917 RepID=A0AAI9TU23_9PEZI|nr:hypothetical protein CCUS01_12488 [Colletotrichum cuscutae]
METDYLVKGGYCNGTLEEDVPDPDVTGWGIVSSFCFSIVMNMIAIMVAYAANALPEERYKSIDSIAYRRVSQAERQRRIKAFESFMLSLSDHQLVTGITLMLTTILIFSGIHDLDDSFSVYSFQIATRLGYFSCITHLCSLSVLWEYFDANISNHSYGGFSSHDDWLHDCIRLCDFSLQSPRFGQVCEKAFQVD